MNRKVSRVRLYLEHILIAIERINRYTREASITTFLHDELMQDAVIRNLEIIGEASHKIETRFPDFSRTHPELPLSSAYQMRNAIAHGYFQVDYEIVWMTIKNELPDFESKIKAAQSSISHD